MKKTFLIGSILSTLMLVLTLGMAGCSNPAMDAEETPANSIVPLLGSLPAEDNDEDQSTDVSDGTDEGQNTGICDGTGQGNGICEGIGTGQRNGNGNGLGQAKGHGQGNGICDGSGIGTGIHCKNP